MGMSVPTMALGRYYCTVSTREEVRIELERASWGHITHDKSRFDAKAVLKVIEMLKVTTFCAPPTAYRMIVQENLHSYNLSSLRHCLSAGEPLNPQVIHVWYYWAHALLSTRFDPLPWQTGRTEPDWKSMTTTAKLRPVQLFLGPSPLSPKFVLMNSSSGGHI